MINGCDKSLYSLQLINSAIKGGDGDGEKSSKFIAMKWSCRFGKYESSTLSDIALVE